MLRGITESLMIQSSMQVRGIQVQTYLDEIQKPKVEIALDDKKGLLPECFIKTIIYDERYEYCPQNVTKFCDGDGSNFGRESSLLSHRLSTYFNKSDYWHQKDRYGGRVLPEHCIGDSPGPSSL